MDNNEIANIIEEIGELLEIEGESPFRIRAYHNAGQVIRGLPQDINDLDEEGRLTAIAGVGQGIADRIHELLSTGKMTYFEELKSRVPESLAQLVQVPGLGPKKAKLVYESLGIETLDQLKKAVAAKKLRNLPGLGARTEENIARGIRQHEEQAGRLLLSQAVPAAENIVNYMKSPASVEMIDVAGSLRRRQETIGDIDILCATDTPEEAADRFCDYREASSVLAKGPTKCSILLTSGLQIDLRLFKPDEYGSALQYFTGSKAHNIKLRALAKKNGLKLSEYGVFDVKTDRRLAAATEEEVYNLLGLDWIDPVLREDRGEIEAAAAHELPDLIDPADIKGDLHTHTKASDGRSSMLEMAEFARELGYSYLAISDHAFKLRVAGGLAPDEWRREWKELAELNRRWDDFTLLRGVELNIDNEGAVDFPDDFLAEFDVVTASIHSGFNQDKHRLTERMVRAIANPRIHVIGHPTARILGRRPPYQIDLPAIFKAAAEHKTTLELNAFPDRLDLRDDYLIEAKKAGCRFAINTDAHHSGQLSHMRYGIATARRAWLSANDVINTYPLVKLKKVLSFTK